MTSTILTNSYKNYELPFAKMHGLGNDFVIINADHLNNIELSILSIKISDRHLGIGCDQFIIYKKFSNYYEMWVYNQDGSEAKACGNAVRCISKLMLVYFNEAHINLHVAGRILECETHGFNTRVNMGSASFTEEWMPKQAELTSIAERYGLSSKDVICVDVGNPHLVMFGNFEAKDKETIGIAMQESVLFPDGVNVNFATKQQNKIYLSVWERGTGLTLACGSGACATYAASNKLTATETDAEIIFALGSLQMSKSGSDIIVSGTASLVANGVFYYAE